MLVGCAPEDGQEQFSFAAPVTFSVPPGDYGADQIVELSSSTPESVIYFTTDGSEPTIDGEYVYDEPILIAGHGTDVEIRAIAVEAGREPSETAAGHYNIWYYDKASTPFLSPAPGIYSQNLVVGIGTKTPDAEIYYTLDGSAPTRHSFRFDGAIMLEIDGAMADIRAVAYRDGMRISDEGGGMIGVDYEALDPPVFTPAPGEYHQDQVITLNPPEPRARVYYTLDGTEPTMDSAVYEAPIEVRGHDSEITVRAVAFVDGMKLSSVAEASYDIQYLPTETPETYPEPGTYNGGQVITLMAQEPEAQIYYTIDGSDPSVRSPRYDAPFFLPAPGDYEVNAIAIRHGRIESVITRSLYELTYNVVQNVAVNPPAGTYIGTQTITLSTTTPDAEIYYTFGDPNQNGEAARYLYTGPIHVSETATVTVQAWKDGWIASSVTAHAFDIQSPSGE